MNIPNSTWMAFVLHVCIVIPCLLECVVTYFRGETFCSLLVVRYFLLVARYVLLVARQEILKDIFLSKTKQNVLHINLYKKFNL